jgi:hypothetical protein
MGGREISLHVNCAVIDNLKISIMAQITGKRLIEVLFKLSQFLFFIFFALENKFVKNFFVVEQKGFLVVYVEKGFLSFILTTRMCSRSHEGLTDVCLPK